MKDKNKKKKYTPILARLNAPREQWEDSQPRLTEEQYNKIKAIKEVVFLSYRTKNITRSNFAEIHERMEEELNDKIKSELGLVGALEWNLEFPPENQRVFAKNGLPPIAEGILPTEQFLRSDIFEYAQRFIPSLVILQFDDYNKFISSAEKAVSEAEKRRAQGDAYMTKDDKAIKYNPRTSSGDTLEDEDELR